MSTQADANSIPRTVQNCNQNHEITLVDRKSNKHYQLQVPELYKLLFEGKVGVDKIKATNGDLEDRKNAKLMNGLHFASIGMNPEVLEYVLENIKNKQSVTIDGYTALHVIVKYGDSDHLQFQKCFEILLANVENNKTDFDNIAPIHHIKHQQCAKAFTSYIKIRDKKGLIHQATLTETINQPTLEKATEIVRGKIVEKQSDKCKEKRKGIGEKKSNKTKPAKTTENEAKNETETEIPDEEEMKKIRQKEKAILIRYLKEKKDEQFIEKLTSITHILHEEEDDITLLQLAVYKKLSFAVNALLLKGQDPNQTCVNYPISPLELCMEYDVSNCLKAIIKHDKVEERKAIEVWKKLCSRLNVDMIKQFINSNKLSKQVLKEEIPVGIFANMPNDTILTLLENDIITLTDIDQDGTMCATGVWKSALSKHLNTCIKFVESREVDQPKARLSNHVNTWEVDPPKSKLSKFVHRLKKFVESRAVDPSNPYSGLEMIYEFDYKTLMPTVVDDAYSEIGLFTYILEHRPDLHSELLHDVVKYFILMKWHSVQYIFFLKLALQSIWSMALITSVLCDKFNNFLTAVTLVIYLLISFYEFVYPRKRLYKLKLVKMLIISIIFASVWNQTSDDKVWNILSATSLILTGYKLLKCAGQWPMFSTIFCIFQTVLETFLQYLLFYSILIIPFAISFYVLFKHDLQMNPFVYIFQAIVMLSGELNVDSIPFNENPFFGHTVFLGFEIVIVITLMNLLNGLAVSETKKAQDANELNAIKAQLYYIKSVEWMTTVKLFKKWIRYFTKNLYFFKDGAEKKIIVINVGNTTEMQIADFKFSCDRIKLGKYGTKSHSTEKLCNSCRKNVNFKDKIY